MKDRLLLKKNYHGFTMVEMLAVLVIISILALIAVPTINGLIGKSRQQYYKTLEGNINIAGTDYFSVERDKRPKYNLSTSDVTLDVLENGKYLKEKVVDAKGKNTCSGYVRSLKEKEGKYSYTTCLVCDGYRSKSLYCDNDYNPDQNNKIYELRAPKTVYSYLGKTIDVNKLEPAILYARNKEVGTVNALHSSIKDIATNIEKVYPKQVEYQKEIDGVLLKATSDLQIYQNEAPTVTFTKQIGTFSFVYIPDTWSNRNIKEKITVANYIHGKFKELQYYDENLNLWKTLSNSKIHNKDFVCNNDDVCITEQLIRSIDDEGNISKSRQSTIKIDKIKPTCSLTISNGTKGDNQFYVSPVTVKIIGEDKDSGVLEKQITNDLNGDIADITYETTKDGNYNFNGEVKDNAGNVNSCSLGPIKIDTTPPVIEKFSVNSEVSNYNALSTKVSITAKDDNGVSEMYLSQTGYQKNGSWENFVTSKTYKLSGNLDGTGRVIYLSLKDKAGNISSKQLSYSVYKECNQTTTTWDNWGACSKSCGTGNQNRTGTKYDKYTNVSCGSDSESRPCNTMDCCSSTKVDSYGSWSICSASCGGGLQYRDVYLVSSYDNSISCGKKDIQDSQACNTQVCPHTHIYGDYIGQKSDKFTNYVKYNSAASWSDCSCGHIHTNINPHYRGRCIICGHEASFKWCADDYWRVS